MTPERIDPLAVMDEACHCLNHRDYQKDRSELLLARAAVAELVSCVGDARDLLDEIDKGVRAEHAKNGHPQSRSVAGIVSERLSAALAAFGRQG